MSREREVQKTYVPGRMRDVNFLSIFPEVFVTSQRYSSILGRAIAMVAILTISRMAVPAAAAVTYHVGSIQEISQGCGGSAEVEQAVDPTQSKYVYEAWIGCQGIGFARSTDGGVRF